LKKPEFLNFLLINRRFFPSLFHHILNPEFNLIFKIRSKSLTRDIQNSIFFERLRDDRRCVLPKLSLENGLKDLPIGGINFFKNNDPTIKN